MRVVLDNSITVGWVHPDQATSYSTALLDGLGRYRPLVPALWVLEFSNTLLSLKRRHRITHEQRHAALLRAQSWKIEVDAAAPQLMALSDLADRHGLTAYDANYLDCAVKNEAHLATHDAALKKVAQALGCWFDIKSL